MGRLGKADEPRARVLRGSPSAETAATARNWQQSDTKNDGRDVGSKDTGSKNASSHDSGKGHSKESDLGRRG